MVRGAQWEHDVPGLILGTLKSNAASVVWISLFCLGFSGYFENPKKLVAITIDSLADNATIYPDAANETAKQKHKGQDNDTATSHRP